MPLSTERDGSARNEILVAVSDDLVAAAVDAAADADPVLDALHTAEGRYQATRALWSQKEEELHEANQQLDQLLDAQQQLVKELAAQQQDIEDLRRQRDEQRARAEEERKRAEEHKAETERQRDRAEEQRARAERLAEGLKSIHRALFVGDIYHLILRTCMAVTGAQRGLFLVGRGAGLRVRSAVNVEGYPQEAPSPFLRALCEKADAEDGSFVANDTSDLPAAPERSSERFANVAVAPVQIAGAPAGYIVVADAPQGFSEDDVRNLLSVGDQAGVALENQRLRRELEAAYLSMVSALADAVEAKDAYTHGHCEHVARLSRRTAEQLALDDGERGVACYGGLLHDVGKIGVSDGILNKPGPLTPEEWTLMQAHVRIGRDLIDRVPALRQVADVVLHHHERWDGGGYPAGLAGKDIPLTARIVCAVDAYCAMTSKRSYKDSMTDAEARAELLRHKGTQFDPQVVDALLAALDTPEPPPDDEDNCCGEPPGFNADDFFHVVRAARD